MAFYKYIKFFIHIFIIIHNAHINTNIAQLSTQQEFMDICLKHI